MTTTANINDSYYRERSPYSPPVSPKSQPHGTKRRASEDETETQHQFSNTFKKLRLGRPARSSDGHSITNTDGTYMVGTEDSSRSNLRDVNLENSPALNLSSATVNHAYHGQNNKHDDFMTVDDTSHRVFVHNLDHEIAEIEAEEAARDQGLRIVGGDDKYSRIPDHLLQSKSDQASEMALILYREPVSISIPVEHDAVRKTILAARRRAQEEQLSSLLPGTVPPVQVQDLDVETAAGDSDEMELD